MRKLTASLVGVVMGGGILIEPVHADIASKLYVDGKISDTTNSLNTKQDKSNLVDTSSYDSTNEEDADSKYPSVKAVKDAISKETTGIKEDVHTVEESLNTHKGMIITSDEYDNETAFDEQHYPSVNAVKQAIEKATSDMATNANLAGKQDKSNLVGTAGYAESEDDTKYPSVAAVKGAITTATQNLASSDDVTSVEQSVEDLGKQVDSVEQGLDTKIPLPTKNECSKPTNKCVLTFNGTNGYEWEVIERATSEISGD